MNISSLPQLPERIAAELGKPVRLKTWSLIVTVFGDAVVPRGGSISAVSLGEIMSAMGIEAGAVRTAISRLAADGWIERHREGRASFYRLAAEREAEFGHAARRIYAGQFSYLSRPDDWMLICQPPEGNAPELPDTAIPLGRDWALVNQAEAGLLGEEIMIYRGEFAQKPGWFQRLVAPESEAEAMRHLLSVFSRLETAIAAKGMPVPLDALALRCLLIHGWRRIALRLRALPPSLLPPDWPEAECRILVSRLYEKLLEPSEAWLGDKARCEKGRLPGPGYELFERFH